MSTFHNAAPRDGETAQRVLNRVRADAATSPGGILAMFAIALMAVAFMTTIAVAVTVFGVWLSVWQSARHRCANMWTGALEAS